MIILVPELAGFLSVGFRRKYEEAAIGASSCEVRTAAPRARGHVRAPPLPGGQPAQGSPSGRPASNHKEGNLHLVPWFTLRGPGSVPYCHDLRRRDAKLDYPKDPDL